MFKNLLSKVFSPIVGALAVVALSFAVLYFLFPLLGPRFKSTTQVFSQIYVVILTVIAITFSYQNWVGPRTELRNHHFSEDGKNMWIELRNTGSAKAIFRVQVWVDDEKPVKDPQVAEEFDNCLFAGIPLPSAQPGAVYPKRTEVEKGDFRKFRNTPRSEFKIDKEYKRNMRIRIETREDLPDREENIIKLPTDETRTPHKVRFKVQQTGENYIFEYTSVNNRIDQDSISLKERYGGKYITGRLRAYKYHLFKK